MFSSGFYGHPVRCRASDTLRNGRSYIFAMTRVSDYHLMLQFVYLSEKVIERVNKIWVHSAGWSLHAAPVEHDPPRRTNQGENVKREIRQPARANNPTTIPTTPCPSSTPATQSRSLVQN